MTTKNTEDTVKRGKTCVIGGDKRQYYLARELASSGYVVSVYAVPDTLNAEVDTDRCIHENITAFSDLEKALCGCSNVILPFPLSPDGVTLNCLEEEKPALRHVFRAISEICKPSAHVYAGAVKERSREIAASFGIMLTDYGAIEEIALENAIPTAEGAVEVAMKHLSVTIRGAKLAVIGYGRCGRELARLLKAMGADVCGVARSPRDRAKMRNDGVTALGLDGLVTAVNGSEIAFNTVPFNIFDCDTLSQLSEGRVIIELASAPGGVDRCCAEEYGVKVIHAPSLPGKYAPKTAAEIIARALLPLPESEAP